MPKLMIVLGSVREGRVGSSLAEWVRRVAEADGRFEVDYADLREIALGVRRGLDSMRSPAGGFIENIAYPYQANAHMHLLEGALAWAEIEGGAWDDMADELVEMAMRVFIDPEGGFLREFFDAQWRPVAGDEGGLIEPGHQFEWAWLLLRWGRLRGRQDAIAAGLRLLEIGETHGVDPARDVGINSLLDDFSVHDASARLWPQTERLKAALLAAEITGKPDWWAVAVKGADSLLRYLDTPIKGLWWDKLSPAGTFTPEPAPASSFYHITCAIAELDRAVKAAG